MRELWSAYSDEVIGSIMVTAILSVFGMIRGFFKKIKKMEDRITELESDLEKNTEFDLHRQSIIDLIHAEMLKK